ANKNKQTAWADFRGKFIALARKRAKVVVPKITRKINTLEAMIDAISNDPTLPEDERSLTTDILKAKLSALEQCHHRSTRAMAKARNILYGETISRYWSKINKTKKPRKLLQRLEKPLEENDNQTQGADDREPTKLYEKNSQNMTNMLGNYHSTIQLDHVPLDEVERARAIESVLNRVTVRITKADKQSLNTKLTDDNVKDALRLSTNNKAPGLNGICYEIWKTINGRFENARAHEKRAFNIISTLRRVFNDIEENGIAPDTSFSESW
ncbi:hypothetical protein BT96DRAFT_773665, partial [Gymnopus androsaceus JB14]